MGEDRQTGRHMTKLIVAFFNSANALKIIMNSEKVTTFMEVISEYFTVVSRPFVVD